jgi:phosphohistidine phosphatase
MKKLIFVRHGRAEEAAEEFTDFERSLTPKGKYVSKIMAQRLAESEKSPGLIISSPAFRALETAIIFAGEFRIKPEKINIDSNLYYKMNYQYLLNLLSTVDNETDVIMLFGHNPSFSDLSNSLSKDGCDYMPKTGITGISFNISKWTDMKRGTGKMEYFLKPEKTV